MATIGEAFIDLHFDAKGLVKEATRAVKAVVVAAAASGIATIFSGVGLSAVSAIPNVAALVSTIASAAPAALIATTGIAALVAGIGTLKLATSGLKNVWKALVDNDMKKFEESLKKLSPAARSFARELKAIFPQLRYLQQTVQEHFFMQFKGDLTLVSKNLLPTFTKRLRDLATTSGIAGHHLAEFLSGDYARKQIDAILVSTNKAFRQLVYVPSQLSRAFLAVATSARFVFVDLASTVASYVTEWTAKIQVAANNGTVRRVIVEGIQTIQTLFAIIGNVAVGIKHVFDAAASAGAAPLKTIETLTAKFRELTGSTQGQNAIRDFFIGVKEAAGGAGGAALNQIINNLLPALGATLVTIAPVATGLINTLGPALTQIVRLIGPVVAVLGQGLATALSQLLPALQPLGAALLQVANAAKPLLNVLGIELAKVITSIAPVLGPIAQLISGLLQALIPVAGALIRAMAPIIDAFVKALLPALPPLQQAFEKMIPSIIAIGIALAPVAGILGKALAEALIRLAPYLPQLATQFAILAQQLAQYFIPILIQMIPYIQPIVDIIGQSLIYVLQQLILLFQQSQPGLAYTITLLKFIGGALDLASYAVTWFVKSFGAINGITVLLAYFQTSFKIVKDAVIANINALIGTYKGLWDLVVKAFNGIVSVVKTSVANTIQAATNLANGIKKWIGDAVNAVKGFGKSVADAISGFGRTLYDGGRRLIGGFIDGIKSMIGAVGSAVGDVMSAAAGFFPHSPAEVGPFSGRGYTSFSGLAMMTDFADAIKATAPVVKSAALTAIGAANVSPSALGVPTLPLTSSAQAAILGAQTSQTSSSGPTVEELLQRLIDAVEKVAPGVGKEINQVGRAARQAGRAY